jgi:hypothetical protein
MSQPDIITISSYNVTEGQTTSNFTAILPQTVIKPQRMILNKFIMPNFCYPFNVNNNIIIITVKDNAQAPLTPQQNTVQIPISTSINWQTAVDFASYLQLTVNTALNLTSCRCKNVFTCSFDITTGKLTFTTLQNVATNPTLPAPNATLNYSFVINSWTNTPFDAVYRMGFTNSLSNIGYNIPSGTPVFVNSLQADSPLNLLATNVIYVSVNIMSASVNDKTDVNYIARGDETIFSVIPMSANFGQLIQFADSFGNFINVNTNSIRSISVRLLDETYKELIIPNNCYASLEFRCFYGDNNLN